MRYFGGLINKRFFLEEYIINCFTYAKFNNKLVKFNIFNFR